MFMRLLASESLWVLTNIESIQMNYYNTSRKLIFEVHSERNICGAALFKLPCQFLTSNYYLPKANS